MRKLIKKVNKTLDEVNRGYFKILFGISIGYLYYSLLNLQKLQELLGKTKNIFYEGLGIVGIIMSMLILIIGVFEITLKEKKEDQKC